MNVTYSSELRDMKISQGEFNFTCRTSTATRHSNSGDEQMMIKALQIRAAIALITFAIGNATAATNREARVLLACGPTWSAIHSCESSNGYYDTAHCKCVRTSPTMNRACALVCFDGYLDAKLCKCVQPK